MYSLHTFCTETVLNMYGVTFVRTLDLYLYAIWSLKYELCYVLSFIYMLIRTTMLLGFRLE